MQPTVPEDNQGHLRGSESEGNAEESHLTPDVQVDGVVFIKTPETRHSADNSTPDVQFHGVVFIKHQKLIPVQLHLLLMFKSTMWCLFNTRNSCKCSKHYK